MARNRLQHKAQFSHRSEIHFNNADDTRDKQLLQQQSLKHELINTVTSCGLLVGFSRKIMFVLDDKINANMCLVRADFHLILTRKPFYILQ